MVENASKRTFALAVSVLAVSAVLASGAAAVGATEQPRARDATAGSTVTDVSGLTVTRSWKIAGADPRTLVGTIEIRNPGASPIATTLVEPLPTTSLQSVRFRPAGVSVTSGNGLARVNVNVSGLTGAHLSYAAKLTPEKKSNSQVRLAAIQSELAATLATAVPSDDDRTLAAMKPRYAGTVTWTEEVAEGVELDLSLLGKTDTISLRLTADTPCRVVARGCRFGAGDSYTTQPLLTALEPSATTLVANASADLPASGFTCQGTEDSGIRTKSWTVDPTGWRLGWEGWQVTQVRFTLVSELSSPETSRCLSARLHHVITGQLTG